MQPQQDSCLGPLLGPPNEPLDGAAIVGVQCLDAEAGTLVFAIRYVSGTLYGLEWDNRPTGAVQTFPYWHTYRQAEFALQALLEITAGLVRIAH